MKKLGAFLFNRWTLRVLGLLALALIIWFVGPLIAIADWRPLEAEWVRWLLILLLVLAYAARIGWGLYAARRKDKQLIDGIAAAPAAEAGQPAAAAPSPAEIETLKARFTAALKTLKQARFGDRKPGWRDRLAMLSPSHHLYQLPWYLFIGAPGSGKTTALLNAGLRFPLAAELGPEAVKGVGGTRNCDWWFTDEAVLLDTAGRYTTQDSDRATDAAAWQGFLQLLKKHRPRRPVNGVLLILSVPDLLSMDRAQRAEHAAALRRRLQELHDGLQLQFPVYVLLTKTDLLAGFNEFFSDLGKDERAQAWGFTFPLAAADVAGAPGLAGWRAEYAALEQRLNARVLERMQQERDPARRALVYGFPQQFAALAAPLGDVLEQVFGGTRFEQQVLLRGVYLTSGTQEGTPLDRVLGSLARSFGLRGAVAAVRPEAGRSYFLTRLLRDVVFREAEVAGTDRAWEQRRRWLQAGALGALALVTVGCLVAWSISYARNSAYVAEVAKRTEAVAREVARFDNAPSTDVVALMPLLRSVRQLAAASEAKGAGDDAPVPWSMGFGLYQGGKLGAAAEQSYRRLLQDALLPRIALRVEQLMLGASADNPELLYEGLKAYLMLHQPAHFEPAALKAFIATDWESSLPREVTTEQRQELEAHLAALLDRGAVASPMPTNDALVARARELLARSTLEQRIYNRLKRQGVGGDIPEFTIARAAGPSAALVFQRASGAPLNRGVPGMYSFDGYHKAFVAEAERVSRQLAAEESWVLGGTRAAPCCRACAGCTCRTTPPPGMRSSATSA